jgi:hypothetical protein
MTLNILKNSRDCDKFVVRFPSGMRDKISGAAEKGHRSMNSDIIHRLSRSMAAESATPQVNESNVLSPVEMSLLKGYREMSGSRREALLQLLGED